MARGEARNQVDPINTAGIHAVAVDADIASRDTQIGQTAIGGEFRCAGGQDTATGIDEAAAAAGNAIGIGDDDIGALSGDFNIAVELAARSPGNFIENHPGATVSQCRIARDIASLLGLRQRACVIENCAALADIELVVAIVRNTGSIGRHDLHDRLAVGGLIHYRTTCGIAVSNDLRAHYRDATEQERNRHAQLRQAHPAGSRSGCRQYSSTSTIAFGRTFTLAGHVFCDGHQCSTTHIENDTVCLLVHFILRLFDRSILVAEAKTGRWRGAAQPRRFHQCPADKGVVA